MLGIETASHHVHNSITVLTIHTGEASLSGGDVGGGALLSEH